MCVLWSSSGFIFVNNISMKTYQKVNVIHFWVFEHTIEKLDLRDVKLSAMGHTSMLIVSGLELHVLKFG